MKGLSVLFLLFSVSLLPAEKFWIASQSQEGAPMVGAWLDTESSSVAELLVEQSENLAARLSGLENRLAAIEVQQAGIVAALEGLRAAIATLVQQFSPPVAKTTETRTLIPWGATWTSGTMQIATPSGYGYSGIKTNLSTQLVGKAWACTFSKDVVVTGTVVSAVMHIRYDDAFTMTINGACPALNLRALAGHNQKLEMFIIPAQVFLKGVNEIKITIYQDGIASTDMYFDCQLTAVVEK